MKRITLTLLSVFLISPCLANIHIQSGAVEAVIKQKISGADAQVAALSEYNAQIKNAGGKNAGIPADGIWQVCTKAGWDISKPDGESKCRDFGNTLMKYASWTFKEVCGKDDFMIKRGTGQCVGDVFSNKILGGTKVNKLIANGLSKEYARVKYSENNLVCNTKIRQTTLPPDDYVQCISMDKNMAYEFRFDSVTETTDYVINEGTESGVCKIFGLKYSPSGYNNVATLGNGQTVGSYESWNAACETTDASICSKVNESMSRFGRSAKIGTTGSKSNKHSACVISGGSVSASNLRTAFGIDNYAFKNSGIQLNANVATQTQVCDWVKKTVKTPQITSCKCNDGFTQIYDFSGAITEVDDVLTCNINGKPVDFVFDDLSESNKKVAKGGAQGMDCMAAGGTYAGEQCINLDEQQCKLLASANLKNCPTCKRVKYQNGVCQLPSGADAENVQKNTNIALIIGGAVVGVGVTVITGGAGAVVVLTGIETLGAAIELGAQLKIDAIADEFLVQSNKCKSASCAKNLIKNNFQHLADSQNDFSAPEISAIDSEMARLANLIPENDDFWADIALNSLSMSDNQSGIFENWTPEQVWRAVGITLQMASVVTSVGKWIGTKAKTAVTKLSKSSKVLIDKTDDVVDIIEHASDTRQLTAKQLELHQKLNLLDPSTLKGDDVELYVLWKKYAPRNQSFNDFKKMGTLSEIQQMSKSWRSWDEIEEFNVIMAKIDNFYVEHPEVKEVFRQPNARNIVQSQYPELFELQTQLGGLDNLPDLEMHRYGNYSTFDPTISSVRKYDSDMQDRSLAIRDDYNNGKITKKEFEQSFADERIKYFNSKLSNNNIDEVAALRVEQLNDIINESPHLQDMRARWYKLSNDEKVNLAQELSDRLLVKNGVRSDNLPQVRNVWKNEGNLGSFGSSTKLAEDGFVYKTDGYVKIDLHQLDSFSDFINTVAHETGGHGVNALNPNAGALGAQMEYVSGNLSGSNGRIYRLEPEEVSAWRIGDAVGATYRPENPLKTIADIRNKVRAQDGARIIDANTWRPISNYSGAFADNLIKGNIAAEIDYSDDIRENLRDISKMLKESGLKIFRTSDRKYVIGTEEIMNSML